MSASPVQYFIPKRAPRLHVCKRGREEWSKANNWARCAVCRRERSIARCRDWHAAHPRKYQRNEMPAAKHTYNRPEGWNPLTAPREARFVWLDEQLRKKGFSTNWHGPIAEQAVMCGASALVEIEAMA